MRNRVQTAVRAATVLLVLLLPGVILAQGGSGTVAEIAGPVEVERQGRWIAVSLGETLHAGETVRTGKQGMVRVVFAESVLLVGDETEISLDEICREGEPRTIFELLRGKVRALVTTLPAEGCERFEVETPTAVVGVRGTEFAAVHDPVGDVSRVVGMRGRTRVHAKIDQRERRAVELVEQELTVVERGKFPTAPRKLDETEFRQYLEGLEFLSAGSSLAPTNGLVTGAAVAGGELAAGLGPVVPGSQSPGGALREQGRWPHPMAPLEGGLVPLGREEPVTQQPPASVQQNKNGNLGIDF